VRFERDARLGDESYGVGRCPFLRPSHQPIKGAAGAPAPDHRRIRGQAGVHQDAGQSARADPKFLSLLLQCGVVSFVEANGDGSGHGLSLAHLDAK
jgi:hypothetical protein